MLVELGKRDPKVRDLAVHAIRHVKDIASVERFAALQRTLFMEKAGDCDDSSIAQRAQSTRQNIARKACQAKRDVSERKNAGQEVSGLNLSGDHYSISLCIPSYYYQIITDLLDRFCRIYKMKWRHLINKKSGRKIYILPSFVL
jgi:hypothetical protein